MSYLTIKNKKIVKNSIMGAPAPAFSFDLNKNVIGVYAKNGDDDDDGHFFFMTKNKEFYEVDDNEEVAKLHDNIIYASAYQNIYSCIGGDGQIFSNLDYFPGSPKGISYKKVCNSDLCLMAIDDNGNLWAFGSNENGQCGLDSSIKNINVFTQITKGFNFVDIQCSSRAMLVIDNEGSVFGCGDFFVKTGSFIIWGLSRFVLKTKEVDITSFFRILLTDNCIIIVNEEGYSFGLGHKFNLGLEPKPISSKNSKYLYDIKFYSEEHYTKNFIVLDALEKLDIVPKTVYRVYDDRGSSYVILKAESGKILTTGDHGFYIMRNTPDLLANENTY